MIQTKEIIKTDKNYLLTLEDIKQKIKTAQVKAHLSVNKEMLILYWQIGKAIVEKQEKEGWGAKITRKLSEDLGKTFPNMRGFSYTNVRYMQRFAENYPDLLICQALLGKMDNNTIVQEPVAQLEKNIFVQEGFTQILNITWYHNIALLDKVKNKEQRLWYANQTIKNGWSRNVLVHQIHTDLFSRQTKKISSTNNFQNTLSLDNSEALQEMVKSEYNLEFIENGKGLIKERKLERALVDNIEKFLLELGKGFAFVGKQHHLEVSGEDFYIDLLFYHIKLKSYIVIELKTGKFKPEYAGKMGFYLTCVDDDLKDENDNNSIGIILCQDEEANEEIRNKSLKCIMKPIGVSNYKLARNEELPKELQPIEKLKKLL